MGKRMSNQQKSHGVVIPRTWIRPIWSEYDLGEVKWEIKLKSQQEGKSLRGLGTQKKSLNCFTVNPKSHYFLRKGEYVYNCRQILE